MNENPFASLFDSSDDDVLSRAIDRFADGESSAVEEAELFARLDATPGAWKQCALALIEARDLRAALSGAGQSRRDEEPLAAFDETVILASQRLSSSESPAPRRRHIVSWSAVALGLVIAFAAGFGVAPREGAGAPSLADAHDAPPENATAPEKSMPNDEPFPQRREDALIASSSRPESTSAPASGPEIVNVVYRPSGDGEETSAPLPVYKSDEDWARALNHVVRQSEADLAGRRAQLLAQGANLERRIVLHPVATEQGEMLLPVETFQIVPISLKSFH